MASHMIYQSVIDYFDLLIFPACNMLHQRNDVEAGVGFYQCLGRVWNQNHQFDYYSFKFAGVALC